jgi:hypothetical protein
MLMVSRTHMLMVLLALLVAPSLQATEKHKGETSPPVPTRVPSLTSDPSRPSYPCRFIWEDLCSGGISHDRCHVCVPGVEREKRKLDR